MLIPTVTMAVLALALFLFAYAKGQGQHIAGTKASLGMLLEILPLLVFAFIVAGMIQVLLPQAWVSQWLGAESGMRGLIIGTVAGGLTPGGPYVSLPVVVGLMRAGAGVGPAVAFLTGWSLWAVGRLPMEVGILGWRLTMIRLVCTFFFPPIAGLLAQMMFGSK